MYVRMYVHTYTVTEYACAQNCVYERACACMQHT